MIELRGLYQYRQDQYGLIMVIAVHAVGVGYSPAAHHQDRTKMEITALEDIYEVYFQYIYINRLGNVIIVNAISSEDSRRLCFGAG